MTQNTFPIKVAAGNGPLTKEYFNQLAAFLSKQVLRARLQTSITNDSTTDEATSSTTATAVDFSFDFAEPTGYVYDTFIGKTSTSFVDTTNSTCLYSENGLVAFCDVLDLHDDASINTSIWSTSTAAGGTATEGSGYLELTTTTTSGSTASAITDGASGLDMHGQNTEVLLDLRLYAKKGSSTPTASARLQVSNGTTHVDLYTVNPGNSETTDIYAFLRVVYDHTNTRCDVWLRYYTVPLQGNNTTVVSRGVETLVANNVSVATVTTNKYIRLVGTSQNSGCESIIRCYAIGYRKNAASAGNADLVVNKTLLASSSLMIFDQAWIGASATPTTAYSLDGTTSYGTDDANLAWGAAAGSGTSVKARMRVAKPTTITADTQNIPVMLGWAALHG